MEILIYLLKSGSLLALFFLVYELLLKRETFFALNRYFLLLGIAIAVVLPFVNFTKTVVLEQTVTATPVSGSELVSDFAFEPLPVPENESFLANVEWMHVFLIIYGAGVLFLLLRLVFSLISLRRIQKSASHSFRENGFRFIEIENEINPFSFFKTIVYNPKLYNKEELEMILHHETTHAKQWHSLDIMLSQLFLVFQWMNPISWIYARRVDQNLEFIADQKTTAEKVEKKSYQIRLLKSAYQGEFSLPVNNFHSFTKNRIIMMNKRKSHNARSLKALLILPFLAAFLMSFQVTTEIKNIYKYADAASLQQHSSVQETAQEKLKKEPITSDQNSTAAQIRSEEIISLTKQTTEIETPKDSLKNKKIVVIYSDNVSGTSRAMDLDELVKLAREKGTKFSEEVKGTYAYVLSENDSLKVQIPDKTTIQNAREEALKAREMAKVAYGYGLSESEFSKFQKGEKVIIQNGSRKNDTTFVKNISQVWVLKDGEMKYIKAEDKKGETVLLQFPISKNTSDRELETIKSKFAEHRIDFRVNRLKRNKSGEITDIKMTIDNRKGSQTQINEKSSSGIKSYSVGFKENHDIFMNAKS